MVLINNTQNLADTFCVFFSKIPFPFSTCWTFWVVSHQALCSRKAAYSFEISLWTAVGRKKILKKKEQQI